MNNRKPSSPALVIGSGFHTATLEPEKLDDEFAVKPNEIDGQGPRTKHYKESFELMQKSEPDKQWLAPADYDLILEMAGSALENPVLRHYMADIDKVVEGTGYFVIDLKSTQDASNRGFTKSVRQFGYLFQACWYMHALRLLGEKPKQFVFIAVEKTAPYATAAYTIKESDINKQFSNMERACQLWASCQSSGIWPGYSDMVETLDLGSQITNNRLNISQLADKFGVSRTYVYRIIEEHELHSVTVGNRRTIDITDFANAVRRDSEGKAA